MTKIEWVNHSTVELIKTNASDDDVACAAWVSNFAEMAQSQPRERVGGLIKYLYKENHTSPFEHGSFTFFADTPIFVSREHMRHRTWSYNETSGRYKELAPRFYIPSHERPLVQIGKIGKYKHIPGTDEQFALMVTNQTKAVEGAWQAYQNQLESGIAREVARNILPLNIMTQFYGTVNPLNALKFLILRDDSQALYEIREVARQYDAIIAETMPLTHAVYKQQREDWSKVREVLGKYTIDEIVSKLDLG